MKLYCMCRVRNDKLDGQEFLAPNRFAPYDKKTDFRTIALQEPMSYVKSGAKQVLLHVRQPNDWTNPITDKDIRKEHFPNVDIFECKVCGATIVRE